eukprot:570183-Pleurochrysis_carterae.AAC.1
MVSTRLRLSSYGSTNVSSIVLRVEGHRVCVGAFAAVHKIAPATIGKIMRNVRRGDREWVTYESTATTKASDRPTLLSEATAWWEQ